MKKSLNPKSNVIFSFFFNFMFLWDRINVEQRHIPKSNFISCLKKRWIIGKLRKTVCSEKTTATNINRLQMGNCIAIRTLQKIKIIFMKFLLFGKIIKILFQFLNLFEISILKITEMWTHMIIITHYFECQHYKNS